MRVLGAPVGDVEPRFPAPGALELVAHVEAQLAEPFDFQLDHVAVHERVQAAVIGAGRQNVAGLQRMDRADPLDAARDLVRHVVGVEVLLQYAVDPQPDLQLVRIADFVGGDDVGADRREGVARLHLVEHVAGRRQAARRAVDEVGVAEHVVHRVGGLHVLGALADDDRHLGFAFEDRRRHVRQHHGVARADDRVRRLVEGVDRRRLGARAVLHVVDRHAVDVDRARAAAGAPARPRPRRRCRARRLPRASGGIRRSARSVR